MSNFEQYLEAIRSVVEADNKKIKSGDIDVLFRKGKYHWQLAWASKDDLKDESYNSIDSWEMQAKGSNPKTGIKLDRTEGSIKSAKVKHNNAIFKEAPNVSGDQLINKNVSKYKNDLKRLIIAGNWVKLVNYILDDMLINMNL